MIRLFIPKNKGKIKTTARGFWQDSKGKIFYDYLEVKNLDYNIHCQGFIDRFNLYLDRIKKEYNQEAIFYTSDNIGYIYYNKNKTDILYNKIIKIVKRQDLRHSIREALRQYNGVTVYIKDSYYLLEVFKND